MTTFIPVAMAPAATAVVADLLIEVRRGALATEPVSLNDVALSKFITGADLPVLVDFWAGWCGPCKRMAPRFAAAARQMPGVRFVKVDSDAAPASGALHNIRSIPTLVLFKGGVEVARQSGAVPTAQLLAWIERHAGATT